MLCGTVLSTQAMAQVDRAAIAAGISGARLMENAGAGVVRAITGRLSPGRVLLLCGPGNNGGDGYVIARRLAAAGWPVRVAALGDPARLKGDAALAAARWNGPIGRLTEPAAGSFDILVDALFGAGLDRPLDPALGARLHELAAGRPQVVAVDVPSGVDGTTGTVSPDTLPADLTVTFACLKPAHLLEPARSFMGEIRCVDIGIPEAAVAAHDTGLRVNGPAEWGAMLPRWAAQEHKYSHGHVLVLGGGATSTGAASMAAIAAARVGADLVTVAAPREALPIYASHAPTLLTRPMENVADLGRLLEDRRFTAMLVGPAFGLGRHSLAVVERVLDARLPCVLDADALTALGDSHLSIDERKLPASTVLTPHDGEFARLFRFTGDRLDRARRAAACAGCIVLLKGADTVIATPDGGARINAQAPAKLATAGTGDVLAGLVVGLMAQGMPAYDAAAAAAWLHARAAERCATPMLATDLAGWIPQILGELSGD
ncbi:MAG: NAD(P)H-hydrate dehydratase [Geminicoccaceae bacterium]